MGNNAIKRISTEEMQALVENFDKPGLKDLLLGKYFAIQFKDDPAKPFVATAADNSTGDCFVEEFGTEKEAVYWLEHTDMSPSQVADMFDETKRDKRDEEAGLMDFRVYCVEKLSTDVVVRAKSKEEAEAIANQAWNDGLIDIDWDNCESCTCKADAKRPINGFGAADYDRYRRTADGKGVEGF